MEEGLIKKTGKDLKYWIGVVKQSRIEKHGEIVKYLKENHGFTHGFANFVSLKARAADAASQNPQELIDNQYKGKESLRPIMEELIKQVSSLGNDITISPKKDSISLVRKKQMALIKPSTKSRIDLGLKLKGMPTTDRLENSGPFGSMCTHRVRLSELHEIDEQLMEWLAEAYDKAG